MKSIVRGNPVSFKTLEQKIYAFVCELTCMMIRIVLEFYDNELATARDIRQYRDKGEERPV